MVGTDIPDLVPARMVNEFCYCPRLFFLEWVQGRFEDNADTVDGRYRHRVVDEQTGRAPLPGEGDLRAARSVTLSSTELGVVARIDLIEGAGDAVIPVDTKRGSPPDNRELSWPPERVQLCLQGLVLREAGYRCDEGVLYFAEARRRVRVEFTEELVRETLGLLDDLRTVAATDAPPPPLVASGKCPRCSLVGLCLPDETNALAARSDLPVRRLVPRDPHHRPLYVTEQGAHVGVSGGRVEIVMKQEVLESVRLLDVAQLCVFGNVQVSTQLMREMFSREVPICFFSYGGWFSGIAEGLPSKHVEIRRRQVAIAHQGGVRVARSVVAGKIRNSRTLLRRNARTDVKEVIASLKRLADQALAAPTIASLLGLEGAAARIYFGAFAGMLRADRSLPGECFSFDGRNRRPPRDAVNCLLSYLYALLVKDLTATTFAVGFDPYLGFYHRPRFGRPALALDLAEEFRPLIAESVTVNVINNGEVSEKSFLVRAGGVGLTKLGRRAVTAAYERRLDHQVTHPVFGYKITYRRVLDVQARLLGAFLLGEVPEYESFTTR